MEWTKSDTASLTVIPLAFRDETGLDPDPLVQLYANLGTQQAHLTVVETLTEIARALGALDQHRPRHGMAELNGLLIQLISQAEPLGMRGLCNVARAVLRCIARQDETAAAATLARLSRIGDSAVSELWQRTRSGG